MSHTGGLGHLAVLALVCFAHGGTCVYWDRPASYMFLSTLWIPLSPERLLSVHATPDGISFVSFLLYWCLPIALSLLLMWCPPPIAIIIVILSTVCTHPWWKLLSYFRSLLSGTQHSLPYSNAESTQTLYMRLLVAAARCLSLKTARFNALDAFAILFFISMCDQPSCTTTEPK